MPPRITPVLHQRGRRRHGGSANLLCPRAGGFFAPTTADNSNPWATVKLTGAQALIRSLEASDVEVVFGLPGGAILPAYDPLRESSVRYILVRHEQGAGHAAEGYAWATGKVAGVCMATSGPGATNLVTALCDAYMDSVPLVAITGQVPSWAIGSDAFQECDTTGITMPVTSTTSLVLDPDRSRGGGRGLPHRRLRPARPGAGRRAQGHPPGHHRVVLAGHHRAARLLAGDPAQRCRSGRRRPCSGGSQAGVVRAVVSPRPGPRTRLARSWGSRPPGRRSPPP